MNTRIAQNMPPDVRKVFDNFPSAARVHLTELRGLIFSVAASDALIGTLTETLKWGEPSYAPSKPRTGTAVRIAWKETQPDQVGLFVNCQTSLIERWREPFSNDLTFAGNREITLPLNAPLPTATLTSCIHDALTYHLRKS